MIENLGWIVAALLLGYIVGNIVRVDPLRGEMRRLIDLIDGKPNLPPAAPPPTV